MQSHETTANLPLKYFIRFIALLSQQQQQQRSALPVINNIDRYWKKHRQR